MRKLVGLLWTGGILLGLLLATPGLTIDFGQSKQNEMLPIRITSDEMLGYKEIQKVIFLGNVVTRRGDLTMNSERLEMTKDINGNNIIMASGNVKINFGSRHALSEKAEFYEVDQKIILKGRPKVWENENIIKGTEMIFYLDEEKSVVKGNKNERMSVTFFPPDQGTSQEKKEKKEPSNREKTKTPSDISLKENAASSSFPISSAPEDGVVAYIKALSDENIHVRRRAVLILGELEDNRASLPLILTLKDPDYYLRWNAAVALGKLGDPQAVLPLIDALNDGHDLVREEAARALGLLGDEKAVDPLTDLTQKDASEAVRQAAFVALEHINLEDR